MQNALPDSASVAVDYPASITDPTYPTSVTDGIDNAIQLVQAYVNACGDASKIALIGFSQGGNVMTDMLAGGVDKPDPLDASYAQYITAVTVFGDPTYTTGQSFDVGNSTKDGVSALVISMWNSGQELMEMTDFLARRRLPCVAEHVCFGHSVVLYGARHFLR